MGGSVCKSLLFADDDDDDNDVSFILSILWEIC